MDQVLFTGGPRRVLCPTPTPRVTALREFHSLGTIRKEIYDSIDNSCG